MRIVFAGTPHAAVPTLEALIASPHDIAAVVTRPDAPAGRGRTLRRSPVAEVADRHGMTVLTPSTARDADFGDHLDRLQPDVCAVVAYGALLPPCLLSVPTHGWVNLHFSLLPAWRGAAPVQHAIIHGDDMTGATTFRIEEGLDTGPVFGTMVEPIGPRDTAGDLLERLASAGAGLMVATLDAIEAGVAEATAQVGEPSRAPKVTREDAEVIWDRPAFHIDRLIRGTTPAPGAWTRWRGERLKLGPVTVLDAQVQLAPGQIENLGSAIAVGTATVPVHLGVVQPPGKRSMPALDWARGARLVTGERFTDE